MKLKLSKLYMFYQYLCLYIFAEKLRKKKIYQKSFFSKICSKCNFFKGFHHPIIFFEIRKFW